jgi:hypothetical protein
MLLYRPIAKGSTSREPHFEHFHRSQRSEASVHGRCLSMSSSIGQECLCPQALHRTPMVSIFLWSWSEASDTSQASRDFSTMALV